MYYFFKEVLNKKKYYSLFSTYFRMWNHFLADRAISYTTPRVSSSDESSVRATLFSRAGSKYGRGTSMYRALENVDSDTEERPGHGSVFAYVYTVPFAGVFYLFGTEYR